MNDKPVLDADGKAQPGGAETQEQAALAAITSGAQRLREALGRVIVGQNEAIDLALVTLLAGGHALIFLDPMSEIAQAMQGGGQGMAPSSSDMRDLLKAWGGPEYVPHWPILEHGLFLDKAGNFWIGGTFEAGANANLLAQVGRGLGLPPGDQRVISVLAETGNTSSASMGIAFDNLRRSGKVKPGDYLLLPAFGAGFTWGAGLCRAR